MEREKEINKLTSEIKSSQSILSALGDETRQHLILVMIQSGDCFGMRVNDIAEKSYLSRTAVSHHLKVLKEAGIVKMRREGTKNYYYFDPDMDAFNSLISMLNHAKAILSELPDRGSVDWY